MVLCLRTGLVFRIYFYALSFQWIGLCLIQFHVYSFCSSWLLLTLISMVECKVPKDEANIVNEWFDGAVSGNGIRDFRS